MTIDYDAILQQLHHEFDLGAVHVQPDLHAIHFCRIFPRLVRHNLGHLRGEYWALEVVRTNLAECLAQLKNTHLEWGVELTESDVMPVMRVLTLARYLETPYELGEAKWEDLIDISQGKHDEVLMKGEMPGHLQSQIKRTWAKWEREENGNDSII